MSDSAQAAVSIDNAQVIRSDRFDTIDFWRGFVLCTIFVNHIPGNVFERLTPKNYGFSDSSEAFVFISGVSLALAYGRRAFAGEDGVVVTSLARRAVKLYMVHIVLSLTGIAIFALGAALTADADLMAMHGRDLVVDDPRSALIGLLSMGHQFGYFNILPMYVLLVAMSPAFLRLARISRGLMLAVSFALYLVSRSGLNIPTWPMTGEWFFDPFAWQLLMAIGLAVGLTLRQAAPAPRSLVLVAISIVVVVVSAACVTDGLTLWPGLNDHARAWADLDKTTLGLGRLIHFLALAYLISVFRIGDVVRSAALFKPLCAIGRHGLAVFALLSVLAAAGQVITFRFGHPLILDVALIVGGLTLLYGFAVLMKDRRDHRVPNFAVAGGHR